MIKFIAFHTGYAETCSTSMMVYQCGFFGHPGYTSPKEAFVNLALDLFAKFYDDVLSYRIPTNKCCEGASVLGSGGSSQLREKYKVCDVCGIPLQERPFSPEDFMSYIRGLHGQTCDSYGDAEDTSTRDPLTWWPFWTNRFIGTPKEEIIFLRENAEWALLDALYYAKPELRVGDEGRQLNKDWEVIKQNKAP